MDDEKQRRWCEAKEHIKLVIEIYKMQIEGGRWFLPAGATSWDMEEMRELGKMQGVEVTVADQCMYELGP